MLNNDDNKGITEVARTLILDGIMNVFLRTLITDLSLAVEKYEDVVRDLKLSQDGSHIQPSDEEMKYAFETCMTLWNAIDTIQKAKGR